MSQLSDYAKLQGRLRTFYALRHIEPDYRLKVRQIARILRAHNNYLALHKRVRDAS